MKTIFNKLVLFLSLALILPILTMQNSMAECGQPGGECGGKPFKDCCDKANYECIGIYTNDVLKSDCDDWGTCTEKKEDEKKEDEKKD